MASVNRVYAARLAGMVVLGPDGESLGGVRDVEVCISFVRDLADGRDKVEEIAANRVAPDAGSDGTTG